MSNLLNSKEFIDLETQYPYLRRAREAVFGLKGLEVVIVDTETTGLDPQKGEIIEIAAFRIKKGEIDDVFTSLINIHQALPPEIIRLTGITDDMLLDGGEKRQVLEQFNEFIKDTPLMAHNVEFDIPFLNFHLNQQHRIFLNNQLICTLRLSRKLLPNLASHRLSKLAEYFQIPTPVTHRATGDVEITYQIWQRMAEMLEKDGISTLEALVKYCPAM